MNGSTIRTAVVIALLLAVSAVAGPDWIENDNVAGGGEDAGSLPPSAQPTTGTGPIARISGFLNDAPTLVGASDLEDMYVILISEPGTFLASTDPALGGFADFDSRLFLFDADGNGLLGNDNSGGGVGSTIGNTSTDATTVEITEAGLYYIAITVAPRVPSNPSGLIFDLGGSPLNAPAPIGAADRHRVRETSNVVLGSGTSTPPTAPPPGGVDCSSYEGPAPIPCGVPEGNTITFESAAEETLLGFIGFEPPGEGFTTIITVFDLDDAEVNGLSIFHLEEGDEACPYIGVELLWDHGCDGAGTYDLLLRAESVLGEDVVGCVEVPLEIVVSCPAFPDCMEPVPGSDDCENSEKDEAIPCGVPEGNTFTIDLLSEESLFADIAFEAPSPELEIEISVCDFDDAQGHGLSIASIFGGGKFCPPLPAAELSWVPECAVAGTYQLLFRARSIVKGISVACVDVPIDIVVTGCVPEGEVSGPDGLGGTEPIEQWVGDPGPLNDGGYVIAMTGVGFSQPDEATVSLQMQGIGAGSVTRCIVFTLVDCDGELVAVEIEQELTFVDGSTSTVLPLTEFCGDYEYLLVRDPAHTLTRALPIIAVGGTCAVDFSGESALVGGDLNGDEFIDILDFGALVGQFNSDPNPGTPGGDTPCGSDIDADFDGSGLVDMVDFTFVQSGFLAVGDGNPCMPGVTIAGGGPRTEIRVTDLERYGLGHLAPADRGGDGIIDLADLSEFFVRNLSAP